MNKVAGNGLLCDTSCKMLPVLYFQVARFNIVEINK